MHKMLSGTADGGVSLQPHKTPHMALTVHVDVVERTGLAISKISFYFIFFQTFYFSDNTLPIILQLLKRMGNKN